MFSIVLVNGYPATGKTTLMRALSRDLNLPALGKDELKEWLSDRLGTDPEQWSADLGRVASESLYTLLERAVSSKRSIILENAYIPRFAVPRLQAILKESPGQYMEVYCECSDAVRLRRWQQRVEEGSRHPVHIGHDEYAAMTPAQVAEKYGPLGLGTLIRYQTDTFSNAAYQTLVQRILSSMKKGDV